MDCPLTTEILNEIATAIRKLGGGPDMVDLTDTRQVNRVLELLGADIYLLATIGSWRDTLPDEEIVSDLRDWNAGRNLAFERSFGRREREE